MNEWMDEWAMNESEERECKRKMHGLQYVVIPLWAEISMVSRDIPGWKCYFSFSLSLFIYMYVYIERRW